MNAHYDAVVIGGGISGLVAALELAKQQLKRVAVFEAGDHFGGCVTGQLISGIQADAGAESFATRSTVIPDLLAELGIADQRIEPNPAGAWLQLPNGPVPMPKTGILGIPGDLDADELRDVLSEAGYHRALQDRDLSTDDWLKRSRQLGGARASVAELVLDRMGDEVLDLLVTPVVAGVHSADPDTLDLESVAPGLLTSMLEEGSLSAGVKKLRLAAQAAKGGNGKPGSAVAGIYGGMNKLSSALEAALREAEVELHSDTPIVRIEADTPYELHSHTDQFTADRIVIATDGPTAVDLLAPLNEVFDQFRPPTGAGVALVSLVVDHQELDDNPRGTGALVSPLVKNIGAKALTHASAKWDWVREDLQAQAPHRHFLRLSYGRISDSSAQLGFASADPDLVEAAIRDASEILGVELRDEHVVDHSVVRWQGALPFATIGHQERVSAFRKELQKLAKISVVGAWLAGTGLVAVISDVQKTLKNER